MSLDTTDGVLEPGLDDILDGVDATVGDTDDLVERDECCLQRGQLNQRL